jgi:hypothetical protein
VTGEEMLRLYVTLGIRRVLWGLALFVVFAFVIAFRTLGAIAGPRR